METPTLDFKKIKVLIVGDVMLDQYWHGGTSRISPEAPVPVVHVNHMDERPGGGANVAIGVSALGAKPYLLGLVGHDEEANRLESLLVNQGVESKLVRVSNHKTITKLRVLSRNQQVIRLDMEEPFVLETDSVGSSLKDTYERALNEIDVVILSDYGKGTLSNSVELIKLARSKGVPVVVDPKSQDFSVYHGASVLTPNLKEFEAVVGKCETDDILVERAFQVLSDYDIGALVVTRSSKGLSVINANGTVTHISAMAREVHDVTGAGDTVISVLGVGVASGMTVAQAANLGNIAAGIAVGRLGAVTVSAHELELALGEDKNVPTGIMDEKTLLSAIRMSKARGEKIVFTNGCFDILHSGHVMYLEQAKKHGDRLVIAVNSDESVSRLKGDQRPINSLEDRMSVLNGLKSVDWVVPFTEDTPTRLITEIMPDILAKGGDYQDINALPGAKEVLSWGGQVHCLDLKEGCSTTRIIDSILSEKDPTLV